MTLPHFHRLPLSPAILAVLFVFALLPGRAAGEHKGYRAHVLPPTLTFSEPTPAYDPEDPARELGDFRAGLSVNVVEARPQEGQWLVKYPRVGQSDILALIAIPNLAKPDSPDFRRLLEVMEGFPLLHRILKSENPWAEDWTALPDEILTSRFTALTGSGDKPSRFVSNETRKDLAWGLEPIRLYYDVANLARPKFVAEFWSKGEAFKRLGFRDEPARNELRRNLQKIASYFDSSGNSVLRERGSNPHIRGLRDSVDSFLLPNDTRVSIYYQRGEYLFLEIDQASVAASHETVERSATELTRFLREKVRKTEDGTRYVGGIPMIDQGRTSYCVPATMTRVLNFYGYDVNTHSLAMLAGTMEQTSAAVGGGTTPADMMRAMRRITNGSPFRLREIRSPAPDAIQSTIDSGLPIIWLIDGHLRLLIGINSEKDVIAYSDSWGPGHDLKLMPYHQFRQRNRGMWVMEPRSL